uniref:Uncharacterized protein n=1 Tax=Anopheles atroparvus TaxID=41427 RepID=A0A182J7R1_ANOAO
NGGFRPVLDNGQPRTTPPLFLPPHLASLSSQFTPPLFPSLKAAFPGLCSCCPVKAPTTSAPSSSPTCTSSSPSTIISSSPSASGLAAITSSVVSGSSLPDPRSSSVAELRRKAQEHSAALLHSLQAAAAAGLAFPGFHLPPLTLHSALSGAGRKPSDFISDLSMHHHHHHHHQQQLAAAHHLGGHLAASMHHHNNNNNISSSINNNTNNATNNSNSSAASSTQHSPSGAAGNTTHHSEASPRTPHSNGPEKPDSNE